MFSKFPDEEVDVVLWVTVVVGTGSQMKTVTGDSSALPAASRIIFITRKCGAFNKNVLMVFKDSSYYYFNGIQYNKKLNL